MLASLLLFTLLAIISIIFLLKKRQKTPYDIIDTISQERSGRIDVYSQDLEFDLKEVRAGGDIAIKSYFAHWLATDDQKKHWIVEGGLSRQWGNMWIEFVPAAAGYILINLRGSFYDNIKQCHHDVWVDDCEMSGAQVQNGGFEMIGSDGKPAYWGWEDNPKRRYSTNGSESRSGKCCVLIWHDIPLVQKVAVEAGKRYKLSVWFKSYSVKSKK